MRLLKFGSRGELSLTKNLVEDIPNYAILSHTWGADDDEVTFDDIKNGSGKSKASGYAKIQFCGEQARRDGLQHFWVDTCCVNKANHVELSEAIISMFRWYRDAVKCYVHLSDVSTRERDHGNQTWWTWESAFQKSRWFTRGWTLQELLAPKIVDFFSQEGEWLGNKNTLERQIHEITTIPITALRGASLSQFSVDERMRWAVGRETKKREDKAYCLLGIFGIFMPLLYGEGENAFIRLQKEINAASRTPINLDKLVTSIHQDTAEIKAAIPSILGGTLDLLKAVGPGISRIQDITTLMHQMVRLTARFTVEMKEDIRRLLQAFWTIQKQLTRLEGFMPRQIYLPIVIFRDAFNVPRSFPYDLCREWRTFQGLVAVAFTGRQGLHRVNMGQYFVTNVRIGRRLNPTYWSNAIEPGDELSMTMILEDIEAEEGFCPYKSCGVSTAGVPLSRGGKICPNCFRFAAISQKKKGFPMICDKHEASESRHEPFIPESELEPLPAESANFEEFKEEEDIELYHSIEVAQTLLIGEGTHAYVIQLWARLGGKGKWIQISVQLNTQANCCTITSAFLREKGISEALPPFNDGHECKHESHSCRVRLSLSGGDHSCRVPFCVLQDEKVVAVMTGQEECWEGITLHAPWAGFGVQPLTE